MAMEPLATQGNFIHVYDFRVKAGSGDRFIEKFNEADYSDDNPMHKSHAQVKDGVLCRDTEDPDRFYLIGEWSDIEVHREVRKTIKRTGPSFVDLIEGGKFEPRWGEVVSSTPQEILDKAAAQQTA